MINIFYSKFKMRANLLELEEKIINYWKINDIYYQIMNQNRKLFLIHDGPPYANGSCHFGHIINKTIKDVLMKKKILKGYKVSFTPGWDCHGTPIELNVNKSISKFDIKKCREYADSQIKIQKEVFEKLGMICDWNNCYKTMDNRMQSREISLFYDFLKRGIVKVGKKVVNWCYECKSTLSDFEVENEIKVLEYFLNIFEIKGIKLLVLSLYNKFNMKIKGVCVNKKEKLFFCRILSENYMLFESQLVYFKSIEFIKKINMSFIKDSSYIFIDRFKTEIIYSNKVKFKNKSKRVFLCNYNNNICWRHKRTVFKTVVRQFYIENNLPKDFYNKFNKCNFYPKKLKKTMLCYFKSKPDWNISRQKKWGVPVCLFIKEKDGKYYYNEDIIKLVEKRGIEAWDKIIAPRGFKKINDILDVWFDSGSTCITFLEDNNRLFVKYPADVYIEGVDQYRGWFNSSSTISYLKNKSICTKNFITHGFVVDGKGIKMSKSLGNYINPILLIKKHSFEILKLYFMSNNYFKNIEITEEKIIDTKTLYIKIRFLIRFMINSIFDFKTKKKIIIKEEIDIYIYNETLNLIKKVDYYDNKYEFFNSLKIIKEFCFEKLSKLYLDSSKDRLYVYKKDSDSRLSCQYTIKFVLENILMLLEPYLSFTCEEAWKTFNKNSILLEVFKDKKTKYSKVKWANILKKRKELFRMKNYDPNRAQKVIINIKRIKFNNLILEKLFKCTKISFDKNLVNIKIINLNNYKKCPRCWNFKLFKEKYCDFCLEIINNVCNK